MFVLTSIPTCLGIFLLYRELMEHNGPRAELERLIIERREDYAGLSRMLGRNAAYIQQFIKRGVPRKLAEEDRRKLASYFGVDEALLGGSAPQATATGLVPIARIHVRASAGPGALAEREQTSHYMAFAPDVLKRICGSSQSDLSVIRVEGDSMAPTLADGDDIMVDRSQAAERLHDGIYVLRRDDTLMVKRVAVHPGTRRLTISSDNPTYPTWSDCEASDIDVVGRVVWAGRKIR